MVYSSLSRCGGPQHASVTHGEHSDDEKERNGVEDSEPLVFRETFRHALRRGSRHGDERHHDNHDEHVLDRPVPGCGILHRRAVEPNEGANKIEDEASNELKVRKDEQIKPNAIVYICIRLVSEPAHYRPHDDCKQHDLYKIT